jgi:hypothetical protein
MDNKVEGIEILGYGWQELAQDLKMYGGLSTAAREHLRTAGKAGARVELQRSGKICQAENEVVKVSRDSCCDAGTGLTSPIYLVESVLFELQNAINWKGYQKLKHDAKGGLISVLQKGLGMSNLEFESTTKVVSILTQIKAAGRPISPWGQKQFSGYAQGITNSANQPHDSGSTGEQRLPSKLYYAYLYLRDDVKEVSRMKQGALKKLATIKQGIRSPNLFDWGVLVNNWATQYGARKPAGFLVIYVDALLWLGNERGWSVNWEGGTQMDWKLCTTDFVRVVPGLRHDRQATEAIKRDIEGIRRWT